MYPVFVISGSPVAHVFKYAIDTKHFVLHNLTAIKYIVKFYRDCRKSNFRKFVMLRSVAY